MITKSTTSFKKVFLLCGQLSICLRAQILGDTRHGSPRHLDKLKDMVFYVVQLQCFSSEADRTSSAQNGSCLYSLLCTRPLAALPWISILPLTKHAWSASPAQPGCARVRTLFSWRPHVCAATQFPLAGRYHTWWMRTQTYKFSWFPVYDKASMKEMVNPLLCGSLPGSAYEYWFIFLLLLTWGLKFRGDLPPLIKATDQLPTYCLQQRMYCAKSLCFQSISLLHRMLCRNGEAFCSHAMYLTIQIFPQCALWPCLSCIRSLLNLAERKIVR